MPKTPNEITALLNEIRNRNLETTNTATGSPAQAPPARVDTPLSVTTQKGEQVTFTQQQGQWYAQVARPLAAGSVPVERLPIRSNGDIPQILASLAEYDNPGYRARRVRVVRPAGGGDPFVHVGALGLAGGDDNDPPTQSDQPTASQQEGRSKPVKGEDKPFSKFFQDQTQEAQTPAPPAARLAPLPPAQRNTRRPSITDAQHYMEQANITSTQELIAALNRGESSPSKAKGLLRWAREYFSWLKQVDSTTRAEDLEELSALAGINPHIPQNKALLSDYFTLLCQKATEQHYGDERLITLLEATLQVMDPAVFEGNSQTLTKLALALLAKLDPEKNEFTPGNYPAYERTLTTLYHTLALIKQVSPDQWNVQQKDGLYTRFKNTLEAIKKKGEQHYPYVYQSQLILQGLAELGIPLSESEKHKRRLFYGAKGVGHSFMVVRNLVSIKLEVKHADWAYENFEKASNSQEIARKAWYTLLKELTNPDLNDAQCCKAIGAALNAIQDVKFKKQDRLPLHYGIVRLLGNLALHAKDVQLRKESTQWLEKLQEHQQWNKDEEVTQAIEGYLTALAQPAPTPVQSKGRVFTEVAQQINKKAEEAKQHSGITPALSARQHLEQLHAHYQSTYGRLSNPFGGRREESQQLSIDQAHFELAILKKPEAQEQDNTKTPKDQIDVLHERSQWEKTPIGLGELFKDREVDGKTQPVQKVLLVAHAGMGKTTLSKKLAHQWAQGKHPGFTTVYVLRVRVLRAAQYDNVKDPLARAIANECFPELMEKIRLDKAQTATEKQGLAREQALIKTINQQLKRKDTLLVLDGLDEREGASKTVLQLAQRGSHKLLMTSRPHGIAAYQEAADLEVDLLGLTPAQREDYVTGYFQDKEQGQRLLGFLKEHPAFGPMVQVPITLQMLCALWEADEKQVQGMGSSTTALYGQLTGYLWKRYDTKYEDQELENQDRNAMFNTLGQIALAGMEKGEALIGEGTIEAVLDKVKKGNKKIQKNMEGTGLLEDMTARMTDRRFLEKVVKEYAFPHLTFQEYFAGQELAQQLLSEDGQEDAEKFLAEHQYETRYQQTLTFMAGKLYQAKKTKGAQQLLRILNKVKKTSDQDSYISLAYHGLKKWVNSNVLQQIDADDLDHLFLQLRCLNEWLQMGMEVQDLEKEFKLLQSFEHVLKQTLKNNKFQNKLLRAFPSISSVLVKSKAIAIYKKALEDKNPSVREGAIAALIEAAKVIPEQALPVLLGACEDENVRSNVAKALKEVAQATPKLALPLLETAIENRHSDILLAAVEGLSHIAQTEPETAEGIITTLQTLAQDKNTDNDVRCAAVKALGGIAKARPEFGEQVIKTLQTLAQDEDADRQVRCNAVDALGGIAKAQPKFSEEITQTLQTLAQDEDAYWKARCNAVDALGGIAKARPEFGEQVIKTLQTLVFNAFRYHDVIQNVLGAFRDIAKAQPKFAKEAIKALQTIALKNGTPEDVPIAVVLALRDIAKAQPKVSEEVIAALQTIAQDKYARWKARRDAVEALRDIAKARAELAQGIITTLQTIALDEDTNSEARHDAVEALRDIAQAKPELVTAAMVKTLHTIAQKDTDSDVRRAAVAGLINIAKARAELVTEELVKTLQTIAQKDTDKYVRIVAVQALRDIAKDRAEFAKDVVKTLQTIAQKDADPEVRSAAAHALEVCKKVVSAQKEQTPKAAPQPKKRPKMGL